MKRSFKATMHGDALSRFIAHRLAASVIAYVVIKVALNSIANIFMLIVGVVFSVKFINIPENFLLIMILCLIWYVVIIIGFHIATNLLLKQRLSLS